MGDAKLGIVFVFIILHERSLGGVVPMVIIKHKTPIELWPQKYCRSSVDHESPSIRLLCQIIENTHENRLSKTHHQLVMTCTFTRLLYMIISRWNQFTHMLIDWFLPSILIAQEITPRHLPKRASLSKWRCWSILSNDILPGVFPPGRHRRCLSSLRYSGLMNACYWLLEISREWHSDES